MTDAFYEVAELLLGDGAGELISKKEMSDKTKRRLTAGLSAVGATAGAAGLGYAAYKTKFPYKAARAAGATRKGALRAAAKEEPFGTALVQVSRGRSRRLTSCTTTRSRRSPRRSQSRR